MIASYFFNLKILMFSKMQSTQIKTLLWKMFLFQKRSPFLTSMEFLLPTIFIVIFLPIRHLINSDVISNDTIFDPFFVESFDDNFVLFKNSSFAYYPNNSTTINKLIEIVSIKLDLKFYCKINFK